METLYHFRESIGEKRENHFHFLKTTNLPKLKISNKTEWLPIIQYLA